MKPIIVVVSGGIVTEIKNIPPHMQVVVHDYDTQGISDDEVARDDDGKTYSMNVFP